MANVGTISIELELIDGNFVARSRRAGQVVRELNGHFGTLSAGMGRAESSMFRMIGSLRDIAIIGHGLGDVFYGLKTLFFDWSLGIVKANAELERMNVLLQGLSKADSKEGRIKEAASDMEFLIQKAQEAPFALKEMTNAFVKLKTTGIDDVRGKLTSLMDAVARFGGGEQELHRANVAIQQMASKGVVSMEELRQQLGEAVPSAMQSMADGMGVSMAELVAQVSKGKVAAVPAIQAMFGEFERAMSGSAARMMETWSGLTSVLDTKWTLFKANIGNAGMFDQAKQGLKDLIDLLNSGVGMEFAASFGSAVGSMINYAETAIKTVYRFRSEIGTGVGAILTWIAAIRSANLAIAAFTGISSMAASVKALNAAWQAAATIITTTVVPGLMGLTSTTVTTTAAVTGLQLVVARFGVVMTALGGPIKVITALLGAGAVGYYLFGDALDNVADKADKARESIKSVTNGKGEMNVFTKESLQEQTGNIKALTDEINELYQKRAILLANKREYSSENKDSTGRIHDLNIAFFESKLDELSKAIESKTIARNKVVAELEKSNQKNIQDIIDREMEEKRKSYDKDLAELSSAYDRKKDLARKDMEEMIRAGMQPKDAQKKFNEEMIQYSKEFYAAQIQITQQRISEEKAIVDAARQSGGDAADFLFSRQSIEEKQKYLAELRLELSNTQTKIKDLEGKGVPSDNAELKSLKASAALTKANIEGVQISIDVLTKKVNELNSKDLLGDGALAKLAAAQEKIKELNKSLPELNQKMDQASKPRVVSLIQSSGEDDAKWLTRMITNAQQLAKEYAKTQAEASGLNGALEAEKMEIKIQTHPEDILELKNAVGDMYRAINDASESAGQPSDVVKSLKEQVVSTMDSVKDLSERFKLIAKADDEITKVGHKVDKLNAKKIQIDTNEFQPSFDPLEKALEILPKLDKETDDYKKRRQELVAVYERELDSEKRLFEATKRAREAKENEVKARHAAEQESKDARDRAKWMMDQENKLTKEIGEEYIKQMKDGVLASQAQRVARIDDLMKMAEAQAIANGLGDPSKSAEKAAFMSQAYNNFAPKVNEAQNMVELTNFNDKKKELEQQIHDIKISLVRDTYEQERMVLDEASRRADEEFAKFQGNERQRQELLDLNHQKRLVQLQELEMRNETAFTSMMNSPMKLRDLLSDVGVTAVNGLADSFAEMATSSKASMKDMVASMLKDIAKLIIKFAIMLAIKTALNSIMGVAESGGTAGGSGSTSTDILKGGLSNFTNDAAAGININTPMKNGGIVRAFANGGMMNAKTINQLKNAPLIKESDMLKGGVEDKPHVALFAEAGIPEAFIPMQDRKNVPVQLNRDSSGNVVNASIPLPSGESIPGKIVGNTAIETLSKFASGGNTGSLTQRGAVTPLSRESSNLSGSDAILMRIEALLSSSNKITSEMIANLSKMASDNASGKSNDVWKSFGAQDMAAQPYSQKQGGEAQDMSKAVAKANSGNVSVSINITNNEKSNNSPKDSTSSKGDGDVESKKAWDQFAERMKSIVLNELAVQKRPGGLLYE